MKTIYLVTGAAGFMGLMSAHSFWSAVMLCVLLC